MTAGLSGLKQQLYLFCAKSFIQKCRASEVNVQIAINLEQITGSDHSAREIFERRWQQHLHKV